jgi:hypothetical protein
MFSFWVRWSLCQNRLDSLISTEFTSKKKGKRMRLPFSEFGVE